MGRSDGGGAADKAWVQMLRFLEQHLEQGVPVQVPAHVSSENALFEWRYYLMLVYEHAFGSSSHRH